MKTLVRGVHAARAFANRTPVRYALFQVPDLILLGLALTAAVHWWELSRTIAYAIFALWIVKDVALYPMMRAAYSSGASKADRLDGATGTVTDALAPVGYVRIASELWRARAAGGDGPIHAGSRVRVVGLTGLTLLVERVADEGA